MPKYARGVAHDDKSAQRTDTLVTLEDLHAVKRQLARAWGLEW